LDSSDLQRLIHDEEIEFVDLQFGDMFGTLNHITFMAKNMNVTTWEAEGIPFDGSSIRAWRSIDKSDMVFFPDFSSAFIDPFRRRKTLVLFGNISDPTTRDLYDRAPRNIARKAVEYMCSLAIADEAYFGPEPEFFIFDSVQYSTQANASFFEIDTVEGPWMSDSETSLGHKIRHKMGYFPASPKDTLMDLRSEIIANMQVMGLEAELHHHEVGTAQNEIGIRYGDIITAGDNVHKYKYAVKNTAYQFGKSATFMPKPIASDNGSGMHVHMSLWKGGSNIFTGEEYASLSPTAVYAIGGLLAHGRAIQVFSNPTGNSYRRLVPGYEAPVKLAYSATNRSAAIRIPYVARDKSRRIEFRCGDSSGCPYLSFSVMLMAMLDGIKNKIEPGIPMDKNIYDLPAQESEDIVSTCESLGEALDELQKDTSFITAGNVFEESFLEAYIEYKRKEEVLPLQLQVTPLEYELYYDV